MVERVDTGTIRDETPVKLDLSEMRSVKVIKGRDATLDRRLALLEWIYKNPQPSLGDLLRSGIYKSRSGVKGAVVWLKDRRLIEWSVGVERSINITKRGRWICQGEQDGRE